MRPILLLQLVLTLWKPRLTSAQETCPNDLCSDGKPNVTDALVLSADCTSEEIAVTIKRIPENVDSNSFDAFAIYYNCSIEIDESKQGVATYFNIYGGPLKKTKTLPVNATQAYSCILTGCVKLFRPACWATLEGKTECEFSVSAKSAVSSYITSTVSSLLSSSTSTTTESSSNTVNTVISSNVFPTSASGVATSEPTTNGGGVATSTHGGGVATTTNGGGVATSTHGGGDGDVATSEPTTNGVATSEPTSGTSTYLEATTSLEQVKTERSSSSVSMVTSVSLNTSNQTPAQLSSPAGGENISTILIVTLSVFTTISSSVVILFLLLVCVTLLLKNIKRTKMESRIGGIIGNEREKSIVIYDGELEIGIQKADMNTLKRSTITLYQSLDDLSQFEKMNTADTIFHDTVIPTHTIQHSPSQIITTTDIAHTDHMSRNLEHGGSNIHVIEDSPEDEYIKTVFEREDCGSYMCSIGSISDNGYVEATDPKYENQVIDDLLDHTMNSNAHGEYIDEEYNNEQPIKDWCTDDENMCSECNTVTAKVNEYVVMTKINNGLDNHMIVT